MRLNLEHIRCLQAVYEQGSLTKASEQLAKAKSAIRYSLQKLEEQAGFNMTVNKNNKITLTSKGEQFLYRARKLLDVTKNLEADIFEIASGIEARISFSSTALFPLNKVAKIIKNVQEEFPNTDIIFHREMMSGEKMLINSSVDIAITGDIANPALFDFKKISEMPLKLVISAQHPFLDLSKKEQTFENLLNYPQIVQKSTLPSTDFKSGAVYDQAQKWFVTDISSKRELILSGLGWGRLPEHEVDHLIKLKRMTHLKHLKLDKVPSIHIAKLKDKKLGLVQQSIWNAF